MRRFVVFGLGLWLGAGAVYAQPSAPDDEIRAKRAAAVAVYTEEAPKVDGVLDEALWQGIEPITEFKQRDPAEGEDATEFTELRIAFDEEAIYFGLMLFDKEPEKIRANIFERGGRIDKDDRIIIALDTYHDRRNAYIFEVSARGTQDDALLTDEQDINWNWDCVYYTETTITDQGWNLEVKIPFNQLRFPKGQDLEMGVAVMRTINRKNEHAIWPFIPRDYQMGVFQVSQYASLTGLRDLKRGRHLEIKPYLITGGQKLNQDGEPESDVVRDAGLDVKYGITSNLTLDLTLNTDFAQVEADNVQINLTRFNLFFPEKREFFLERAGLFSFGTPGRVETFFSRRIGIDNDILAGARVTGQTGPLSLGLLNIQTKKQDGVPGDNFAVARARADVLPRTTIGGIFTNRENPDEYNRALGADLAMRFWGNSELTAWLTHVWDFDDRVVTDFAGSANLDLRRDLYNLSLGYLNVGENFNPGMGFVRRRDMIRYDADATVRPLIGDGTGAIRRLLFSAGGNYISGQDLDKQSTHVQAHAVVLFRARDHLGVQVARSFERLDDPFFIRPETVIPMDDYTWNQAVLFGGTDQSRRLWVSAELSNGGFFNGDRTNVSGGVGFRFSKHFKAEGQVNYNRIALPVDNGNFDATTVGVNLQAATSRKLFARALIQYDNFSKDFQANIRIDWIHTPGSDLFLVFNTSYTFDDHVNFREAALNDRVGVAKLTYLVTL